MVVEVQKAPIALFVLLFFGYLIPQLYFSFGKKELDRKIKEDDSKETKEQHKFYTWISKWYSSLYVLVVLLILYTT